MARMMLIVGDLQVHVSPVPGSVSDLARRMTVPEDHPLAAGDHEVGFYEVTGMGDEHFATAVMSEKEALDLVAAWLVCDNGSNEYAVAEGLLRKYFSHGALARDLSWLLP